MSHFNRYTGTPIKCVDELPCISVNQLKKLGLLNATRVKSFDWQLNPSADGKETLLHIEVRSEGLTVYLNNIGYQIALTSISVGFGLRSSFECPNCSRSIFKLYVCDTVLGCQRCLKLPHRTRRLTKRDRLLLKAWRVNYKLGWYNLALCAIGEKPKRMRSLIFESLLAERESIIKKALEMDLARLTKHHPLPWGVGR